jgi:hypothetical protein
MGTGSHRLFATARRTLVSVSLMFTALIAYAATPTCWAMEIGGQLGLEGEVVQSALERDGQDRVCHLKVKLRFTNAGDRPVIVLLGTYGEQNEWWVLNAFLYQSLQDSRDGRFFTGRSAGPANSRSLPAWHNLRKKLQTSAPPQGLTYIIGPQKTFPTVIETFIIIKDGDNIAPKSRIWFKLRLEMWPLNLEPAQSTELARTFGVSLQQKWQPFGDLWLENILSAPILFDLPQ